MANVTIEFNGICVHVAFDQLPPPEFPAYGRRIVLPNGNPLQIQQNPHLNGQMSPHYARLCVPASATINGPAAPLFTATVQDAEAMLVLNLNIVGMNPFPVSQPTPPTIGLRGATLQLVGAYGGEPLTAETLHCIPHLSASLGFTAHVSEDVRNRNANKVSAYFDVVTGTLFGFQTDLQQVITQLQATTVGPTAQILITPWDGGAPTLVTLPEDPELSYAVVQNEPYGIDQDSDNDFLLSFVVTADEWPTGNLALQSGCPGGSPVHHSEGGPGCSNSGIP